MAMALNGNSLPSQFSKITTSVSDDAKDYGMVNSNEVNLLPATIIITLYK